MASVTAEGGGLALAGPPSRGRWPSCAHQLYVSDRRHQYCSPFQREGALAAIHLGSSREPLFPFSLIGLSGLRFSVPDRNNGSDNVLTPVLNEQLACRIVVVQ